jgi:hypothetical protein
MEKGETDLTDCAAAQCMHNLALLCEVINHAEVMCSKKACRVCDLLSTNYTIAQCQMSISRRSRNV